MSFEGIPKEETPEVFNKKDILSKLEETIDNLRERLENSGQEISSETAEFYEEVMSVAQSAFGGGTVDRESFLRELEYRKTTGKTSKEVIDFIIKQTRD
jgi:hypothetical protein